MTAEKIVELLIAEFKTDQAGLAKMLGVHKSTISNIQNRHTQSISANLARKILDIRPEIDYNFLMGKTDTMFLGDHERKNIRKTTSLKCLGKEELSISEITQFMIQNISEFEKDEVFRIYKNSVENEAKIKLLEEHIGLRPNSEGES